MARPSTVTHHAALGTWEITSNNGILIYRCRAPNEECKKCVYVCTCPHGPASHCPHKYSSCMYVCLHVCVCVCMCVPAPKAQPSTAPHKASSCSASSPAACPGGIIQVLVCMQIYLFVSFNMFRYRGVIKVQ